MTVTVSNYGQLVNVKTNKRTNVLELEDESGNAISIGVTAEDLQAVIRLIGPPDGAEDVETEADPVEIGDAPDDVGLDDMVAGGDEDEGPQSI